MRVRVGDRTATIGVEATRPYIDAFATDEFSTGMRILQSNIGERGQVETPDAFREHQPRCSPREQRCNGARLVKTFTEPKLTYERGELFCRGAELECGTL